MRIKKILQESTNITNRNALIANFTRYETENAFDYFIAECRNYKPANWLFKKINVNNRFDAAGGIAIWNYCKKNKFTLHEIVYLHFIENNVTGVINEILTSEDFVNNIDFGKIISYIVTFKTPNSIVESGFGIYVRWLEMSQIDQLMQYEKKLGFYILMSAAAHRRRDIICHIITKYPEFSFVGILNVNGNDGENNLDYCNRHKFTYLEFTAIFHKLIGLTEISVDLRPDMEKVNAFLARIISR